MINILKTPTFIDYLEFKDKRNLSLKDYIISFFDGIRFKIFPLNYLGNNYLVHTYIYIQENSKKNSNEINLKKIKATLTICPKAFNPMLYAGHLKISKKYIDGDYLILNDNNTDFYQFNNKTLSNKNHDILSWECMVDTLRNIIVNLGHHENPMYLDVEETPLVAFNKLKNKMIFGIKYYSNSIEEPKTFYYASENKKEKVNSKTSGFETFYLNWNKKVNHHVSIIHYTDLDSWINFYKNSSLLINN